MASIQFTVPGRPQGKARPRFADGHAYTPQSTRHYERTVAMAAARVIRHAADWSQAGPKAVHISAFFPVARSLSKVEKTRRMGSAYTHKPDADNIAKAILDGINGIAFCDDSQVVELHVRKRYAMTPDAVGVSVHVSDVE